MRLVYISSPLRGDMEKNKEKAKDYCAYAASCGVIPLAPHTIFTQYLNDAVPEQREQGLRMGHELLERCDELWVMGDTISQGMKDEMGYLIADFGETLGGKLLIFTLGFLHR